MGQPIYEYRCVAGPTVIAVKNERERARAVSEFQDIINAEASDGWEYVGIDEFQTTEPVGCLGMGGRQNFTFKMLVFRRLRA